MEAGVEDWSAWWQAIASAPGLAELLAERKRRLLGRSRREAPLPIYDLHAAALRDAGFREVGVIWQNLDNRVLMAVNSGGGP